MVPSSSNNNSKQTVVPEVALRWILLHATNSNTDLASVSNVSRSWRDVATTVILEQATHKSIASGPMLLLPSMAAQLTRKNTDTTSATSNEDTLMKDNTAASKKQDENAITNNNNNSQPILSETFCAAWFAPEGIQLLDLDAEQEQSDDEDESSDDYSNAQPKSKPGMHRHCRHAATNNNAQKKKKNTHPNNPAMMMNLQRRPPRLEQIPPPPQAWGRGHHPQVRPSFEDQGILVSHEWRGYRRAMEVLFPFGYAEFFVQHVLQKAQHVNRRKDSSDSNSKQQQDVEADHGDFTQASFAVRGATIARPEGYCLCWEYPTTTAKQVEWVRTNPESKKDNEEMVQTIKWQERQRKLKQWKEWRRQLQLTVLPQVLVRRPPNNGAVVQFLNSDEKHAVRFLTPKFQCGPIGEPVTIFVVGIATEDGCFCSGLRHRFELGHLYPNNSLAELAEMSPICMATDAWEYTPEKKTTPAGPKRTPLEQHLDAGEDSEDESVDDDYSNDDSSSDLADDSNHVPPHKKRGWLSNCACIFQDNSDPCGLLDDDSNSDGGKKENASGAKGSEREDSQTLREEDDDDDDDGSGEDGHHDADRIVRGSRIPGMWHCYTAVFDGKHSVLRVDGVPEVLKTERKTAKKGGCSGDTAKGDARSRRGPRPMLDGLTIGSDHCFDMTLCFGQGSGGEGEGAIAEIAVFSGCLETRDLEVVEKQLMSTHGIPIPKLTREALVQEDDWTCRAHALYCQMPPEAAAAHLRHSNGTVPASDQRTIPLRVMAKHRSVAWHQINSVTGEELRIKRIGSRSAGSSSDW